MDTSGLAGGMCSWLLRSEEMAGLTMMVRAPTLGSLVSLPLLVSQPWIHQPSIIPTVTPGCSSQILYLYHLHLFYIYIYMNYIYSMSLLFPSILYLYQLHLFYC